MGMGLSLCVSDTSVRVPDNQTAEIRPTVLNTRYQILNASLPTIQIQVNELEQSPRSVDSNQSVLSAISPTKDRVLCGRSIFQSPMPLHHASQHHHQLRLGSQAPTYKESAVAQSTLITDFIRHDDLAGLEEYVAVHQVDLATLRFQKLSYTPLHVAVLHNQLSVVQYLLQKGVDVDAKDMDGQSAVYLAYTLGHYAIAEALVAHKAASFCTSPYSPYANSSATGGRSRSSSTSARSSQDSRGGRDRVFSVGADDDGVSEIVVPRFSSFRSVGSIGNSIQRDSAKYTATSKSDSVTFAMPSPHTTDSSSSAAVHSTSDIRPQKPLSRRLRKAAGKVMHLVLPRANNPVNGSRGSEVFRPSLI